MRRWWRDRRVQAATLALLALLAAGFAAQTAVGVVRWTTYDRTVTGEVTQRGNGGKACSSDVAFVVGGERYATTWGLCRKDVGQTVTVRYDGDDPSRATADGWRRTFLYRTPAAVVFGALSVPLALGARDVARRTPPPTRAP